MEIIKELMGKDFTTDLDSILKWILETYNVFIFLIITETGAIGVNIVDLNKRDTFTIAKTKETKIFNNELDAKLYGIDVFSKTYINV